MSDRLRPVPNDPSEVQVVSMIEADDEWWLTAPGDYMTSAIEMMRRDGSDWQRGVLVSWPARRNHSDEQKDIRLVMSGQDAVNFVETLLHTVEWMAAAGLIDPEGITK